ncbi:unnamed protein product [Caenorhabditis bovis]|uniref:Uncharacterized protein n=1 Tax=Caenorhabditis bovis TaxID=2654633 RepID=A0A8S1EL47_9PELO|nr:unnamed protein product [Caenorhabditis bovis]
MTSNRSPRGPLFSTTTGYSEIDELNRILLVERELVLKTQENYRNLKQNFVELSKENEQLRAKIEAIERENFENEDVRDNFATLQQKSAQIIKNMQLDNEEREARYEQFRVEVLEELQCVYRKEIASQNSEIAKLRNDRNELVKENDELLEKISDFHSEIENLKRKEKQREAEIREEYDKKMMEMIKNESKVSPTFLKFSEVIDDLREQLNKKEASHLARCQQLGETLIERNKDIENLKRNENSLKIEIIGLKQKIEEAERKGNEDKLKEKEIEIAQANRKLEANLKERINLEAQIRESERSWEKRMEDAQEAFAVQISKIESICIKKDERIRELESAVDGLDDLQKLIEKTENSRRIEQENRERLEKELKNLYGKLDAVNEEKETFMAGIRLERNILEQSVVELKKQLETTPETVAEVTKLRTALRESENKRFNDKERYQTLLSEMKVALKSIEKQQRNTQNKLRETLAAKLL